MRVWLRYMGLSLGAVVVGSGIAWAFLDSAGRAGLLVAALVALALQGALYAMLSRLKGRDNGFLLGLVGGAFARMLAVATVGVVATSVETGLGQGPLILGLVGFLFALLLLEIGYVRETHGLNGPNESA